MNSLTKEQFYARHAASAKWNALDSKQKKQRWKSYLAGTSDKSVVPLKKVASKKIGSPSGGSQKGKAAYQAAAGLGGYKLSPRTHDFLTARFNPFCPRIASVGYPTAALGGTLKVRGFARGSLLCNAAGFGFIMASPGSLAGNNPSIGFSNAATYAAVSDAFPASSAPIGSGAATLTGIPFTTAGTASLTTLCRIVAGGIRIRNTTPLLTKGGSAKSINLPLLQDLFLCTGAQILGPFAKYSGWYDLADASTPWMSCIWSPVATSDLAVTFGSQNASRVEGGWFNLATTNTLNDEFMNGFIVSGAPNGTFDWEVVYFYEYFGPPSLTDQNSLTNTMMTPSNPDPIGQAIVTATLTNSSNAMAKAADGGVDLSSVMDVIGAAARSVLGSSNASDFLASVMPAPASDIGVTLPSPGSSSLQGWASDSGSGVMADLESRFFQLAGREVGSALPEVAAALAI